MKRSILKMVFLVLCFCTFPIFVKAECSSSEKVQINTQASYLTYNYKYNEEDESFSVTFDNVTSNISLEYDDKIYKASKNGITIKNVDEGKLMMIKVVASDNTNCPMDTLRIINYRVPFLNHFINSTECDLYPEVEICNTKFFSYELTERVFKNMFNTQKEQFIEKPIPEPVVEKTWKDVVIEYLYKYGMQVTLFSLGTLSMFIIGHSAVKKAKSKF